MTYEELKSMDQYECGEYIRSERKKRGYSLKELDEAIHLSSTAIAKWENGERSPHKESVDSLLKFFKDTPVLPYFELDYELHKRHWWPETLAKKLGVTTETVRKWLKKAAVSEDYVRKVAKLFADEPREKYDIRAIRKKKGIPAEEAAKIIFVAPSTLKSWETCRARPHTEDLTKLLKFYEEYTA